MAHWACIDAISEMRKCSAVAREKLLLSDYGESILSPAKAMLGPF